MYLWRDGIGKDKPNALIKISSHIDGIYRERLKKEAQTYNYFYVFYIYNFKTIQSEVIFQLADLNMELGLTFSLAVI